MKNVKRFIYRMLYRCYLWQSANVGEAFEMASLEGDHDAMVYWEKLYAKYFEKSEKYYEKLKELDCRKEGA